MFWRKFSISDCVPYFSRLSISLSSPVTMHTYSFFFYVAHTLSCCSYFPCLLFYLSFIVLIIHIHAHSPVEKCVLNGWKKASSLSWKTPQNWLGDFRNINADQPCCCCRRCFFLECVCEHTAIAGTVMPISLTIRWLYRQRDYNCSVYMTVNLVH